MNIIGKDEILRRKTVSDNKNNTNDLTFDSSNGNARAAAYKSSREALDAKEIRELQEATDESEMLHELELLERDYIYGR
jgi:hypothetical protein